MKQSNIANIPELSDYEQREAARFADLDFARWFRDDFRPIMGGWQY